MKIALVCSHGGHFTEMQELLPAFSGHEIIFITYHSARESETNTFGKAYFLHNIGLNPIRLLFSFPRFFLIFFRTKPDIVITTGAEIGLPAIYVGRMMGKYTIYVESWCRVETASLTGRLVYPVAHEFLVQWPQMLKIYGKKARYKGSVL